MTTWYPRGPAAGRGRETAETVTTTGIQSIDASTSVRRQPSIPSGGLNGADGAGGLGDDDQTVLS